MVGLLLAKQSAFQIYCANRLFSKGVLSSVIIEEGTSFEPDEFSRSTRRTIGKIPELVRELHRPLNGLFRVVNSVLYARYFGNQRFHNERILGSNWERFDPNLRVAHWKTVNEAGAVGQITELAPQVIFVCGTGMIRRHVIASTNAPIVNMHAGWSPDYRGHGIIPALARGDIAHLGVTVHLLDETSDGGPILYQEKLSIDVEDNFYSLQLKTVHIGTELFIRAFEDLRTTGSLVGVKQDLQRGRLFTGQYMKAHQSDVFRAWRRLRSEQSRGS